MKRAKHLYNYIKENTDIFKNPEFVTANSALTAEGTLYLIMKHIDTSIYDKTYAVLGDGELGKALTDLFSKLGLDYKIYSRKLGNLSTIDWNKNIYLNTIPAPVFGKDVIARLTDCDYVIDLASAPGGVDFDALEEKNIEYKHALALPGKYCPKSAGELIGKILTKEKR